MYCCATNVRTWMSWRGRRRPTLLAAEPPHCPPPLGEITPGGRDRVKEVKEEVRVRGERDNKEEVRDENYQNDVLPYISLSSRFFYNLHRYFHHNKATANITVIIIFFNI